MDYAACVPISWRQRDIFIVVKLIAHQMRPVVPSEESHVQVRGQFEDAEAYQYH